MAPQAQGRLSSEVQVRKFQLALTLFLLLILAVIAFLAYKLHEYDSYKEAIYPGVSAASIPLEGKTQEQARETLEDMVVAPLSQPIALEYQEDAIILLPSDVNFEIYVDNMVEEAYYLGRGEQTEFWDGYIKFLTEGIPPVNEDIPLQYSYEQELVRDFLEEIALERDQPLREVQAVTDTLSFIPGQPGRKLDIDLSLPRTERALTSADERDVTLVVEALEPAPPDIGLLRSMVQHRIDEFAGIVSIYIADPVTDDRIEINPDVIYSGMSVIKIGIMLDTILHFEGQELDEETKDIMLKVVTDPTGSNYWANLLLGIIGDGNQFEGCRRFTARMAELGLTRTFIREPYRLEVEGGRPGPGLAKLRLLQGPISANPDPFIQTSARDMGMLLEMIYDCSQGEGRLLEDYAGSITPEGCQLILDDLKQNPVRTMIGAGIPEDTPLAHKHGFAYDTHADAGVVFSPGGDYVIVHFQYAPTDWLVWAISQPVFEDVSFATHNFFNVGQE
jgi:beta-lactamase class A